MTRTLLLLAAGLLLGCAHVRDDDSVCPEYRSLRCAKTPECAMDRQRGCRVCQCPDATGMQQRAPDPTQPGGSEPIR